MLRRASQGLLAQLFSWEGVRNLVSVGGWACDTRALSSSYLGDSLCAYSMHLLFYCLEHSSIKVLICPCPPQSSTYSSKSLSSTRSHLPHGQLCLQNRSLV